MVGDAPYDIEVALKLFKKTDSVLAALTDEVGPFGLEFEFNRTCFQSLLRSIVYQQLSGKAAASILQRVLQRYDNNFPTPRQLLATDDDELRGCGLSRGKIRAVKDLAEKTDRGLLPGQRDIAAMSDDEIIKSYCTVHGIGPWTAEMLLIFNLGRPDVLPVSDLGVRRGFSVAYQMASLPSVAELGTQGENWKPFRSVASWYLWQAAAPDFRSK